jgi:uncharacterized Ntn-hydrolase superfamily protein
VTFSLVACDLDARQWGVVVASRFLAVGAVVPWAQAEVGAVATQASANVSYGPRGLELLATGASAQETLDRLMEEDPGRPERQVGLVDAAGRSATYTGPVEALRAGLCRAGQPARRRGRGRGARGHVRGDGGAAGRAAAGVAGRGRQSAAVIVREADGGYGGGTDILIDLRVDDHPDPVTELQRLYAIQDLLFGRTPEDQLIPLEQVQAELAELLARVGHPGPVEPGLREWAGMENLEERLYDDRIDPVVLRALRERVEG